TTGSDGNSVKNVKYFGFHPGTPGQYPEQIVDGLMVPGVVKNDSERDWNVAKTYVITNEQALQAVAFAEGYSEQYNVLSNNCVDFAVGVFSHVGLSAPTSKHYWTLAVPRWKQIMADFLGYGDALRIPKYGYSPADAGADMRAMLTQTIRVDSNGKAYVNTVVMKSSE
ncbi:hypothetical protein, partial [Paenibacillus koleovorans]|uniref:hypothetical protein n=1 Tax=Paenibacillus koleovorans TaxID=121608 RepID=UPI001C3FD696